MPYVFYFISNEEFTLPSTFCLHISETALKLDTLVGDIEDAVSSTVSRNLRKCPGHNSEVSAPRVIRVICFFSFSSIVSYL